MTERYCLTNDKFDAMLREMGKLHDQKNAGYATEGDPMRNFRECEKFGIPMYQGLAVRISDKMSRWVNIVGDANKDKVGESIEDTSIDTAVYLLLFLIALKEYKALNYADILDPLPPEEDGYVTDNQYVDMVAAYTPDQYEQRNEPKAHNNDYFARNAKKDEYDC